MDLSNWLDPPHFSLLEMHSKIGMGIIRRNNGAKHIMVDNNIEAVDICSMQPMLRFLETIVHFSL